MNRPSKPIRPAPSASAPEVVLSFDVEEHGRIEAAAGLVLDPGLAIEYLARVAPTTRWLLGALADRGIRATFFVLGQVAEAEPGLVAEIAEAGHEVASHGWDHRRIHTLSPPEFRGDVRKSRDALEQAAGTSVLGYRAPTFSVVRATSWALEVLAEEGLLYDSSIYPIRHDRYGIPDAPKGPFLAGSGTRTILELPPASLRLPGVNLPAGGGGYFRLLPLSLMRAAIGQGARGRPALPSVLYFHPWEFDPDQPRLPLRPLSRWRTYVGIGRARSRLASLMDSGYRFVRAIDVARDLDARRETLPRFDPRPSPSPSLLEVRS